MHDTATSTAVTANPADRDAVTAGLGQHGRRIGTVTGDGSIVLGEVVVSLDDAVAANTKGVVA